jgi:hypothetical protein
LPGTADPLSGWKGKIGEPLCYCSSCVSKFYPGWWVACATWSGMLRIPSRELCEKVSNIPRTKNPPVFDRRKIRGGAKRRPFAVRQTENVRLYDGCNQPIHDGYRLGRYVRSLERASCTPTNSNPSSVCRVANLQGGTIKPQRPSLDYRRRGSRVSVNRQRYRSVSIENNVRTTRPNIL